MNETPALSDDETRLGVDISDESLEAAAASDRAGPFSFSFCTSVYVCPWS
jgi:hypothetical protein